MSCLLNRSRWQSSLLVLWLGLILHASVAESAQPVDLLIVAGQSNAVGYDTDPAELPASELDQQILFWWRTGDPPPDAADSTSSKAWTTLQVQPKGSPRRDGKPRQYGNFVSPAGGFGPEIGFARTLYEAEKKPLAVLKVAFSGTSLAHDWNPDGEGVEDACYRALLTEADLAITTAKKQGIELRPRAFVWIQGESDANATDSVLYAERMQAMIETLRNKWKAPELLALVAVNTQFQKDKNPFMPTIVAQQQRFAARDPRSEYVDTSSATIANVYHYDSAGTLLVGKLFAESLLRLEKDRQPRQPPELNTREKLLAGEAVKVVCFGDSVTGVYYHTGSRRAYTDMLGIALGRFAQPTQVEMVNAGISGNTTVNALARIERDVLAHRPDLVTVMFGLNDMTRVSLDDYRANLRTIIQRCRSVDAEVVLATPNNVIDTPGRPIVKLEQYCEVVREVGRELHVPVCDAYRELAEFRAADPFAWRLLLSDPIHPNMAGHKRLATALAETITGQRIALDNVPPPEQPIGQTLKKLQNKEPVRVLAMPPFDDLFAESIKSRHDDAKLEIEPWPVEGKSLAEIEQSAKARVRAMKPDLVVISVPRGVQADSDETFARDFAWVMNWSLNFGPPTWDVVVVHPAVFENDSTDSGRDELIRKLVSAQDLHLIDRPRGNTQPAAELIEAWFQKQIDDDANEE